MKKPKIKEGQSLSYLRWFWWFIWEDNSIYSWVANILLAFVLIKFIVYPGLGFILATSHPIVAVVSGSMEHKIQYDCTALGQTCEKKNLNLCGLSFEAKEQINFDKYWRYCGRWYELRGIEKNDFEKYSFKNGFNKGDIIVLLGKNPKDLKIGDVIVFWTETRAEPIIHRAIFINETANGLLFTTKGDHNGRSDSVIDTDIREDNIIGKAYFRIPYLGYIKIWFVEMFLFIKNIIGV